jgi:hypothetical protein
VHRANPNGTFDAICLACFRTVASAQREETLTLAEHSHHCDPVDMIERGAFKFSGN